MNQKGVAIYLAIVIMFIILGIGLALSTILIGQIRMVRGMEDSVVALYAADTGIERELYESRVNPGTEKSVGVTYSGLLDLDGDGGSVTNCPIDLSDPDDACYKVTITSTSPYTVQSIGVYQGVRRAIEISF